MIQDKNPPVLSQVGTASLVFSDWFRPNQSPHESGLNHMVSSPLSDCTAEIVNKRLNVTPDCILT